MLSEDDWAPVSLWVRRPEIQRGPHKDRCEISRASRFPKRIDRRTHILLYCDGVVDERGLGDVLLLPGEQAWNYHDQDQPGTSPVVWRGTAITVPTRSYAVRTCWFSAGIWNGIQFSAGQPNLK